MSAFRTDNVNVAAPARLQRSFAWRCLQFLAMPFFRLWVRTHVVGTENIDDKQGGLLLLNHQSFLDPVAAAIRLKRPVSFMAREGLFRVPVVSWVLRNTYSQPISQTAFRGSSIRRAVGRMHQGFLVGIFPEGERSSGAVKKFNRGFLSLVRRVDLPIYPVGIVGGDQLMPRGSFLIRPGKITVVFGQPITENERERLRTGRNDEELAEMMRQRVVECMARAGYSSNTE